MPLVVAVTLVLSMFGVQAERILTTCRHAATGNSTPCVNDTIQGKTIDLPVFTGRTEGYFIYNFSHLELTSIETWPSMPTIMYRSLIQQLDESPIDCVHFPYFDGYLGMLDLRGNPNLVLTIDIGVYTQLNNDKFYLGIDQPSNSTAALKACWGNQSFVRPIQTFDLIYEYGHGALGYGYDNDWKLVNVCCLGCTEPYTLVHTRAPTPKPTRGPAFVDPKARTGVTVIVVIASIALFALLVTLAKKFIDKRRLAQNATPTTTGQAPYVEQL
ncbi:hypothetical protein Ae201684P_007574 [Aphanomyces euteiches]|nr:hypothetical protein Ae201684P_007574 [Aphanomyces euteiches]